MGIVGTGAIFAIAGLIFLICALAQWMQNRSYAACSERTSATVVYKARRRSKHGIRYELQVTYPVDGSDYKRWIVVDATTYESTAEGSPFEICYKPQNPKRAVWPEALNPKNVRVILIIGAALTLIGVILFFVGRTA